MDGFLDFLESLDSRLHPQGWLPSSYRALAASVSQRPLFFDQALWFLTQNPTTYIRFAFQALAENKLQVFSLKTRSTKIASHISDPILHSLEADLDEWLESNPFQTSLSEDFSYALHEVEKMILSWLDELSPTHPAAPVLIAALPSLIRYYQRLPYQGAPLIQAVAWATYEDRSCSSSPRSSSSLTTSDSLSSSSLFTTENASSIPFQNSIKKQQVLTLLLDAAELFSSLKSRAHLPDKPYFIVNCVDVDSRLRAFLSVIRYISMPHTQTVPYRYVFQSVEPFLILGPTITPSANLYSLYVLSLNSLANDAKKTPSTERAFPSPLLLLERMERLSGLNKDFLLALLRLSGGKGLYPLNHLEDLRFAKVAVLAPKNLLPQLSQLSSDLLQLGTNLHPSCLPDLVTLNQGASIPAFFIAAQNGHARFLKRLIASKPSLLEERDSLNRSALLVAAQYHQPATLQVLLKDLPQSAQLDRDPLSNTILHFAIRLPRDRADLLYTSLALHEFTQKATLSFILKQNNPLLLLAQNKIRRTFLDQLLSDLFRRPNAQAPSQAQREHQLSLLKISLPFLSSDLFSIPNPEGDFPLHLALNSPHTPAGVWLVKRCLELSSPTELFIQPNAKGLTPLHIAAQKNNINAVRRIAHAIPLQALKIADSDGLSPVEIAQKQGHHQILSWLSGHEVERALDGQPPHPPILQQALEDGLIDKAVTLIQRGAQLSSLCVRDYPLELIYHFALYSNLPQWIEIYNQSAAHLPSFSEADLAQKRQTLEAETLALIRSLNQAKLDEMPTQIIRQVSKKHGKTLAISEKSCVQLTLNDFTTELFQEADHTVVATTLLGPSQAQDTRTHALTFSAHANLSIGSLSTASESSLCSLHEQSSPFKRRRLDHPGQTSPSPNL